MVVPPGNEGSRWPPAHVTCTRNGSGPEAPGSDTATAGSADRQLDGAWRVWERLRAFDRRYATFVDVVLAAGLFVLCSGWVIETPAAVPASWFVAALIFPLVFRRRAPMTVFLTIAAVAFVQWLVDRTGTGRRLAPRRPLHRRARVGVGARRGGVGHPRGGCRHGHGALDADGQRRQVLRVPHRPRASPRCWPGVVVRALRSQLDWLAERAERLELERDQQASLAAAAERARIAREMHDVVSHNIQVMVTLADAASMAAGLGPGAGGGGDAGGLEHGTPGADRHAPHARRAARGAGRLARRRTGASRPPFAAPSRACATSMHSSSGCGAPASPSRSSGRAGPSRSRAPPA